MIRSRKYMDGILCAVTLAAASGAGAAPVVYTLRTVADGQLGSRIFYEALVTIRMKSDTSSVQMSPGSIGGVLYANHQGVATVTITDTHGTSTTATFKPGEVYVRFDAGAGVAGFGSSISPNYPVALGCDNLPYPPNAYTANCVQGDWGPNLGETSYENGTANVLAQLAYYPASTWTSYGRYFSPATVAMPKNLAQSSLITGRAQSCAALYGVVPDGFGGQLLSTCLARAPRGLVTDRGGFFLRDLVGGSNFGPFLNGWNNWEVANVGSLQVEVLQGSED